MPEPRIKLGSLLAGIGREAAPNDEEQRAFEAAIERDRTPAEPIDFDG